jgi:outer membrane protein OmpA-like peptidoglycan-associated protein
MEGAMKKACLALMVLALAGCQTEQQTSAQPSVTPQVTAPLEPTQPAQQVTSAGPLRRAEVGTYMDAQESDLRSYLRGQGVLVARRGDGLVVNIPNDKLFDHADVSKWGSAVLTSIAQVLAHYDHSAVEVDAYTDSTGSDEQNLALSQKRATVVSDALARDGVAAARLKANGLGATNPKSSDPKDPRNRRIELKVTPTPSG